MRAAWPTPPQNRKASRVADSDDGQGVEAMSERQLPIILAFGATQTLAWASSFYLPAMLANPIARDLASPATGSSARPPLRW
jgi:hypothetical protein